MVSQCFEVTRRGFLASSTAAAAALSAERLAAQPPRGPAEAKTVLIVVGPSDHPPGTHEVEASAKLLQYALDHAELSVPVEARVSRGWPAGTELLDRVDTVVFAGDRFPLAVMPDAERNMADLSRMVERGCGVVCIHYATGLEADHVAEDGDHPLLRWIGGYFATRCNHHKSVARVFKEATIEPADGGHPVTRGVGAFTVHDEPYLNNYFGPSGMRDDVVPLATAMLPPEKPERQVVAWATERPDGGRGAGIVMPHFYRNWAVDPLRKLIVNAIVWSAGIDVPAGGVDTLLADLAMFGPAAVEP